MFKSSMSLTLRLEDVAEPALAIRINQTYHPGMSALALYEATRGIWKVGIRRERAHLALAIHAGSIVEVYQIADWHPAGTTPYGTRTFQNPTGRWEFTGVVAEQAVRDKYVGRSVASWFERGSANPITYVNID